jgi:hypothetical protein
MNCPESFSEEYDATVSHAVISALQQKFPNIGSDCPLRCPAVAHRGDRHRDRIRERDHLHERAGETDLIRRCIDLLDAP